MRIKVGSIVKVNHPNAVINPTEYFEIIEIEHDMCVLPKTWVRGKDTCWFNANMILNVKE